MKRHVGDFVRRCLTCQQVKVEHSRPAGLLQAFGGSGVEVEACHDELCDPLATDIIGA